MIGGRRADRSDETLRRRGLHWVTGHPARLALSAYTLAILVTTALLHLPVSRADGSRASLVDSLFNATSAICVTGLVTVDTATYWSTFGHTVLAFAIKLGGLGTLTITAIVVRMVSRRLGLGQRLMAARETRAMNVGEVGSLLTTIAVVSTAFEAIVAAVIFPRFLVREDTVPTAAGHALFYAVSSFNNAGFTIHPGGLPPGTSSDWWLAPPLALAVLVGSLGFPVYLEVIRRWRTPSRWGLHTRLTLRMTVILLAVSVVVFGAMEWTNPATLGALSVPDRMMSTVFTAIMPRSAGLSVIDIGRMHEPTWFFTDAMMFIGGGSASTAGGIRVTTLAVLVYAALAEARGHQDVNIAQRRLPVGVVRVSVSVVLLSALTVWTGTTALLLLTHFSLDQVLFEVISAFATCGLTTGITPDLPAPAKLILSALMLFGRAGMLTLVAAITARQRDLVYRYPEERPIVG